MQTKKPNRNQIYKTKKRFNPMDGIAKKGNEEKNRTANKVHISERVQCAFQPRFSHRRSVLSDMNALRNPLRNMHQPLAVSLECDTMLSK